jgi:hypothetical protein
VRTGRQKDIVQSLRKKGHDATTAEALLASFQEILAEYQRLLARVLAERDV